MRRVIGLGLAVVLAAGTAGCGARLNEDKTVEVGAEDGSRDVIVPAVANEQKVKGSFKSNNGASFDVYVFIGSKKPSGDAPKKADQLFGKEKATEGNFEVTVPAKEDLYVRIVKRDKAVNANVKLTN